MPEPPPTPAFDRVLAEELPAPVFLTRVEADGEWRLILPELAGVLPQPYPIFSVDETEVITHGYPVLIGEQMRAFRREIERLIEHETAYRTALVQRKEFDKTSLVTLRERYGTAAVHLLENALLNDYARGFTEILLLFHSGDLAAALATVRAQVARLDTGIARDHGDGFRWQIARVVADLLQRAYLTAQTRLRKLAQQVSPSAPSPLLGALTGDLLLLVEPTPAAQLLESPPAPLQSAVDEHRRLLAAVGQTWRERPDLAHVAAVLLDGLGDLDDPRAAFAPTLWETLERLGVTGSLGIEKATAARVVELGRTLKRYELLAAVRRRVEQVESRGSSYVLSARRPPVRIASSARPLDYARPGVVDTAVRRFGLIYDLSEFTAQIEAVRRQGKQAESRALHLMYAFQERVESVRTGHRLVFEKFLGDGAFFSSRRAAPMLVAACEIQEIYRELCARGFPFDRGMRIALNYASYHLMPMSSGDGSTRFEFFGHGIVELSRLTTGKSRRELEEIAELLVHAGYEPGAVDEFLRPLAAARGRDEGGRRGRFAAWIDERGELVNEGIVLTAPFLQQLEREAGPERAQIAEHDGESWVVLPLENGRTSTWVGLRYLGIVRLKGLSNLDVLEATPWRGEAHGEPLELGEPLLVHLRRMVTSVDEAERDEGPVPPELVVVTFLDDDGDRSWVFGCYDDGEDTLVNAVEVPLSPPDLDDGEPLEMWLFRSRFELARLYEGLSRDADGEPRPLSPLRDRDGYLGCFLAAPHRTPG